ncbi:MAG: DUF2892 domain-containing protein [Sphingobacteriales bacterium]|jgi:hypothetical protein|nr:MAG: DUF2892 domain-containing protein [Sphingobacteriales bacterium]
MKKNMGSLDKMIRVIIATVILVLYFTKIITGTLAIVLLVLAIVFAVTSFINFCPLYTVLGINTNKKES